MHSHEVAGGLLHRNKDQRISLDYLYSFLAKANVEVLEYNSRIMHVHDIIEIATSLEKKSDPHEVAGGLLHCGLSGDFNNLFHVRLFCAVSCFT